MGISRFILGLFLALPAGAKVAKPFYMGLSVEASPPFTDMDSSSGKPEIKSGILKDLAEALAKELKVNLKLVPLPKQRVAPDLVSGNIGLVCYTHENWLPKIKDQVLWSNSIYTNTNYVVRTVTPKVSKIEDLYNKRVGTVVNFVYPQLDKAFEKNLIQRENGPGTESNIQKILHGRIDYLILSNLEYEYHRKKNPQLIADDIGIGTLPVKCALSKNASISLDKLNNAIESLRKNGTLEKIFTP